MKTIILPGYSPQNKEWAEDLKKDMKLGHEVVVHEWKHWPSASSGSPRGSFSAPREVEAILEKAGEEKINLIGKSVGVRIAMRLLSEIKERVNKIILCGIASVSEDSKKAYQKALTDFPSEKIIVFQNTKDPFVPYSEVKKFINSINHKIKVVEKPGSEHHYPYPDDFQKFLE